MNEAIHDTVYHEQFSNLKPTLPIQNIKGAKKFAIIAYPYMVISKNTNLSFSYKHDV